MRGLAITAVVFGTRDAGLASPRPLPFADMSHARYYAAPRRATAHLVAAASTSGRGGAGVRPTGAGRRERVLRRASQISETLDRLEADAPLASYDLRLPELAAAPAGSRTDAAPSIFRSGAGSSSSESSESSDSEDERPAAAVGVATISVCQGKACAKRGAARVEAALHASTAGLPGVAVHACKCLGQCKRGPAVGVEMPDGQKVIYVGVAGAESAVQLAAVVLPTL